MITTTAFPDEARERLTEYLFTPGRALPTGLGTKEAACSIAAVNLALTGHLSDEIPNCMSWVIGQWVRAVQDVMPDELRNSERWKRALIEAVGTGNEHERERSDLLLDWMWDTVLPPMQSVVDKHGLGKVRREMWEERTENAALVAAAAACNVKSSSAHNAYCAAFSAAGSAADYLEVGAYLSAHVASVASYSACVIAADASFSDAWESFDPAGLLERLVAVGAGGTGEAR